MSELYPRPRWLYLKEKLDDIRYPVLKALGIVGVGALATVLAVHTAQGQSDREKYTLSNLAKNLDKANPAGHVALVSAGNGSLGNLEIGDVNSDCKLTLHITEDRFGAIIGSTSNGSSLPIAQENNLLTRPISNPADLKSQLVSTMNSEC